MVRRKLLAGEIFMETEITRMRQMKTEIILVLSGSSGAIKSGLL